MSFPAGFLWGTATASHQVEGGNVNNEWWDWEQKGGRIFDGSVSGRACDHYHLYRQDFDLLAALHQNAHRLSLEWSRIEPRPGEYDPEAIRHYRDAIEYLRTRGMEPVVTIHHFTHPRWFVERGGWENQEAVDAFGRYVRKVVDIYGDLVRYWVTINEPVVYTTMGYLAGVWPPGKVSPRLALVVLHNLILAHARAARILHERSPRPDVQVGVAHHVRVFDPYRRFVLPDHLVARIGEACFNRSVLQALLDGRFHFPFGRGAVPEGENALDFIGLNYYSREMATFDFRRFRSAFGSFFAHPSHPKTAAGWEIYPEGLYRSLKFLGRFNKPIMVTENGVADEHDELRPAFLISHLKELHRSVEDGIPVKGYLHWSAIDNFEWAEGRRLRFGLIHVDYDTLERTVKPSGEIYAKICAANGIEARLLARYS
jgi:beta-glucosidase